MAKNNKKSQKGDNILDQAYIKFLAGLFKELGLAGFLVVFLSAFFLIFSNRNQKLRFIDTFILLDDAEQNKYPCVIIILTLIVLVLIGSYFYRKEIKLMRRENNRIGEEKSKLQEKLLEKSLESSD